MTAEQRFWLKVDKAAPGGCWVWVAAKQFGYGRFWNGRRMSVAHRWAYEAINGPVPDGLQLDHLCRNRACVNPAHLELVTSRENTIRGISPMAINAAKTHCKHGHPFDEVNTYIQPSDGGRRCISCWRARYTQPITKEPPR